MSKAIEVDEDKNTSGNASGDARVAHPAPPPRMLYFGVWWTDSSGHCLVDENGHGVRKEQRGSFPWNEWGGDIDGKLQPHRKGCDLRSYCPCTSDKQGVAALHHKDGWTALSFWDRSLDGRGGCNSNYFAAGTFTFDEMVSMAKARFSERWAKMDFDVVPLVSAQDTKTVASTVEAVTERPDCSVQHDHGSDVTNHQPDSLNEHGV